MKRIWAILIGVLLLAGCTKEGAAPQVVPEPTTAVTAEPATAVPTVLVKQHIIIDAAPKATSMPKESPTPTRSPSLTPSPEPTATPEPTPEPGPLAGIIIGLDPGHQLIYDPAPEPVAPGARETKQKVAGGCKGIRSGVYEYEVNLNVGLLLRDLLKEAGATVVMTHEVLDVNISNAQRAQMFNEAKVDLGIRLHCNKGNDYKLVGAFMIVPTQNRTQFYDENVRAAKTILAAYCEETGLPTRFDEGMTYRSDQAGFNWCERPVLTIEMGHLTNPGEDALLSSPAFQARMAQGLFNGILRYFRPDLAEAANE